MFALAAAGCRHNKERAAAAPEDEECFGARCVEEAEAAMYYKDFETAREPLALVCEKGDAFQCFRLAELHHYGRGGPVDLDKAAVIYEDACTREYGEACERRSELARDGHGGPAVELEFAVKACNTGRPVACARAGDQFNTARGVERDEVQAIELFQKACSLGEVDGCTGAADLLFNSKSMPDARSRGLTAYISACSGHSGYGCMKAAVAFHEGLGTKRDLDKAAAHFKRACEFQESDGCHNAKQLEESAGQPVVLALTTAVAEIGHDGLEARSLTCRMTEQGLPALGDIMARVARRKSALDSCTKDGAAVKVKWEFAEGKVQDVSAKGRISKKAAKCISWSLRKAKIRTTGSCEAVLLLGDPDGAAKALAARISREQKAKDRNAPRTLRMDDEDD